MIYMDILEWSAVLFTAWCIWLAGKNDIKTWPVGIIATVLFGVLFYKSKLYADTLLQVFFVGTSIYGWKQWHMKTPGGEELPIKSVPAHVILLMMGAGLAVTFSYAEVLRAYTDSPVPLADSAVLAFSVIGQLLLMYRYIQTWPVWIIVNTISVPLYVSRGLDVSAAVYAAFWLHAWYAWYKWGKAN